MASSAGFQVETLEALLDKCTDPATGKEDWRYINAFCDRVNKDYDGPLVSTQLIIRKLQTFEEKSSLMALSVLDACVKNCGQKYHQEIGKFRFLNELIKLLSSKYDGARTAQPVKHKVIELFYSWSVGLPSEPKIKEAYLMLKRQGVVLADPHLPSQVEQYRPTPQQKMAVFEDDEKSKLLSRLLASKHPDDLQAANRLIKNMVRQDEIREEKLSLRIQELEMVQNNTKLLNDMLTQYTYNTSSADVDLMKELYDSCEKLRTDLFKLAGAATEESDDTLSDILRANDELAKVIEDYRRIVGVSGSTTASISSSSTPSTDQNVNRNAVEPSSNLSSLIDLDTGNTGNTAQTASSIDPSLLTNDLQDLVLSPSTTARPQVLQQNPSIPFAPMNQHLAGSPRPLLAPWPSAAVSSGFPTANTSVNTIRGVQPYNTGMTPSMFPRAPIMLPSQHQSMTPSGNTSWSASVVNRAAPEVSKPREPSPLDLLGQEALSAHKESQSKPKIESNPPFGRNDAMLLDVGTSQTIPSIPPPPPAAVQSANENHPPKVNHDAILEQITLPMENIKPGNLQPMTVLDKNDLKTVMHFAKDSSGSLRADIHVIVVSTLSTNASPVKSFTFQCAAPKSMKLKLQAPTSNELPGYNPILPPAAVTQVMLLSNPAKDRIRLKYRISYEMNGAKSVETGDLDNFPIL